MNIVTKAFVYATECHTSTNHLYDGKPYMFHINMCVEFANKFIHLVPEEERDNIVAGCYLHDVIEDCRQTYSDVLKATNPIIAEFVFAVTNEKGRFRKDRANAKYYEGIRTIPNAVFIKLCDRIANIYHGACTGSSMLKTYRKENAEFHKELFCVQYQEMFDYMDKLLKESE